MAKTEFFAKSKEGFLKKLFGAAVLSLGLFAFAGTKAMAATETENNGGIATANEISVNEKVTGNISTRDDEDWYKFTLNEPGTISLTFSHEGCDDLEYSDWETMLKGDGELFNYSWDGGGEDEKNTRSFNVAAGTYYLRVKRGNSHNSAQYGVKINYISAIGRADEQETNGSEGNANAIELNKEYKGRISLRNDVDWYKFTLNEPGAISLTFSHEGCDDLEYSDWETMLKGDGELFNYSWDGGGEGENNTRSFNVAAGTYYLRVKRGNSHNSAQYGVKINYISAIGRADEQETNDSEGNANAIELNKEYKGRISLRNDVDWYKFTLNEPGTISLTFSHEGCDDLEYSDWETMLKGKDELFNCAWNGGGESEKTTDNYMVSGGTYYLRVKRGNSHNPAEYGVKINFTPAGSKTMLRLYNPNSGEHFYTSSEREKNALVAQGWNFEGKAWEAPEFSNTPVYRLYNKNSGDHHYTPSKKERDNLIKQGWKDEGIGWYSDDNKRVPLYRLYNPNAVTGQHHYTTSARERDNLVKQGWKDENIGWYGL